LASAAVPVNRQSAGRRAAQVLARERQVGRGDRGAIREPSPQISEERVRA
jgi:hypothetical protein